MIKNGRKIGSVFLRPKLEFVWTGENYPQQMRFLLVHNGEAEKQIYDFIIAISEGIGNLCLKYIYIVKSFSLLSSIPVIRFITRLIFTIKISSIW